MIRKLAEKADLKTRAELERVGYSDITVYEGLLLPEGMSYGEGLKAGRHPVMPGGGRVEGRQVSGHARWRRAESRQASGHVRWRRTDISKVIWQRKKAGGCGNRKDRNNHVL